MEMDCTRDSYGNLLQDGDRVEISINDERYLGKRGTIRRIDRHTITLVMDCDSKRHRVCPVLVVRLQRGL